MWEGKIIAICSIGDTPDDEVLGKSEIKDKDLKCFEYVKNGIDMAMNKYN